MRSKTSQTYRRGNQFRLWRGFFNSETAKTIMKILGLEKEIHSENSRIRPENSEVLHLVSDNSKAKELIGWEPEINFSDGLENYKICIRKY